MEVTQNDRTNDLHKTIAQDKMTSCPRMEMMNDTFRCSRATQVHMEDLRLVNLTEKCPSQSDEQVKAPCYCSGWMKMPVNNQTKFADKRKTYNCLMIQQPNRLELLHGE